MSVLALVFKTAFISIIAHFWFGTGTGVSIVPIIVVAVFSIFIGIIVPVIIFVLLIIIIGPIITIIIVLIPFNTLSFWGIRNLRGSLSGAVAVSFVGVGIISTTVIISSITFWSLRGVGVVPFLLAPSGAITNMSILLRFDFGDELIFR